MLLHKVSSWAGKLNRIAASHSSRRDLGRQVKDVPDWRQQVDSAVDVVCHNCGPGIELSHRTIQGSNKNAYAGVLAAVGILEAQIGLEV